MRAPYDWSSSFGPTIAAYLALKRALGREYFHEEDVFRDLDKFLAGHGRGGRRLTGRTFAAWSLTLNRLSPTCRRSSMRIVRNLCLYLRRSEPGCFLPDPSSFPAPHPRGRPYIFSHQEVAALLREAEKKQRYVNSPLCPEVFRLAIVLLYTLGLRRRELIRLVLSDYNPVEQTLLVRASKFHKSRLVALSADATAEMVKYLRARRRLPHPPDAPLLTADGEGRRPYAGPVIWRSLRGLMRRAGIRTASGRVPRVHDIRHTYAVHALLRWYHQGADVQAKLPALAAAMGHVSIVSTAYYLPMLPPVAEAASRRFEHHCGPLLGEERGGDR